MKKVYFAQVLGFIKHGVGQELAGKFDTAVDNLVVTPFDSEGFEVQVVSDEGINPAHLDDIMVSAAPLSGDDNIIIHDDVEYHYLGAIDGYHQDSTSADDEKYQG